MFSDVLIWHFTKDGEFTVRSRYRITINLNHLSGSSSSDEAARWRLKIWKLDVPQKVKLVLWRVCKGWLPTRAILACQGVGTELWCPICSNHVETTSHTFWGCAFARLVWKSAGFSTLMAKFVSTSEPRNKAKRMQLLRWSPPPVGVMAIDVEVAVDDHRHSFATGHVQEDMMIAWGAGRDSGDYERCAVGKICKFEESLGPLRLLCRDQSPIKSECTSNRSWNNCRRHPCIDEFLWNFGFLSYF